MLSMKSLSELRYSKIAVSCRTDDEYIELRNEYLDSCYHSQIWNRHRNKTCISLYDSVEEEMYFNDMEHYENKGFEILSMTQFKRRYK